MTLEPLTFSVKVLSGMPFLDLKVDTPPAGTRL
ncbi:hypothetical protein ES703_37667 [subsurface metagenome]